MTEDLKQKILSRVKDDLVKIETALSENLDPHYDLVADIARHILFSGGKRLRPLLMILCARLCGYNGDDIDKFSTIFEYLHAATLLHDDLVDDATVRRGRPLAHSVWDNPTAVGAEELGLRLFDGDDSPQQTLKTAYSLEAGLGEMAATRTALEMGADAQDRPTRWRTGSRWRRSISE